MKSALRIAIVLALVAVIAFVGLWVWLSRSWLPGPGKEALTNAVSRALGRSFEVGDVSLGLGGGLTFKNITLHEGPAESAPFVEAKEVKIRVRLLDLIFRRKLTVTSIQLRDVLLHGKAEGLRANLALQGSIKIPLDPSHEVEAGGALFITEGNLSGLPYVGSIEELNGSVFLDEKEITAHDLEAAIFAIPVKVEATLDRTDAPKLSIRASSDADLKPVAELIQEKLKGLRPEFSLSGRLSAQAFYLLPLERPQDYEISGSLKLKNARLAHPKIAQELKDVSADIVFEKDRVDLKEVKALFGKTSYLLKGTLVMEEYPLARLKIESQDALYSTVLGIQPDRIEIQSLEGLYRNVSFKARGLVPSLRSAPSLNLEGTLDINLADLNQLLPGDDFVQTIPAEGAIRMEGAVEIRGKEISQINGRARITSPGLTVWRYQLNRTEATAALSAGRLTLENLSAGLYGGRVRAVGGIDLKAPGKPYEGRLNVSRVELAGLLPPKTVERKMISGKVNAEAYFYGKQEDIGTLTGEGRILLDEGQIWEIPLLAGLGRVLKLPGLDTIPIYGAQGDFVVQEKKIMSDRLVLKSSYYELVAQGDIGFDKSLNLNIIAQVSPENPDPTGQLPILSDKFLKYSEIEITGTLDKPKYNPKYLRPDRILWDTLQRGVLEPLLERLK
ncbi:MAG: hypothetical protein HYY14_06085 [Candidatus Omnitrophica bacterium]|nr:hypothetical protein [Candidatus Omnitrophota bacterium]